MEKIVDERKKNGKYKSLRDFVQRTGIGYAECSILIQCGAMDCFAEQIYNSLKRLDLSNHMKFYHKLEFISGSQKRNAERLTEDSFVLYTRPLLMRMLDIELHRKKLKSDATINLFEDDKYIEELLKISGINNVRKYSIAQVCKTEYETFGYMVSRHPLEFYSKFVDDPSITLAEELSLNKGKKVKVIGWLMTSKRIRTRKGDIMKFLSLEDLTGTFEAVIFPKEYEKYAPYTLSMGPYLIEGYVDNELGDTVTVKKLSVINSRIALRMNQIDDAENVYKNTEKILDEEFRMIEDIADDMVYKQLVNF